MTEYVCTCDAIYVEQKRAQIKAHPQSATALWNNLRQLIETIRTAVLEIYRWNNDAQLNFSNGSARMIIRPDRIDLV